MTKLPLPVLDSTDEWHVTTLETEHLFASEYPAVIRIEHNPTGITRTYSLTKSTLVALAENTSDGYNEVFFRHIIQSMQHSIRQQIAEREPIKVESQQRLLEDK